MHGQTCPPLQVAQSPFIPPIRDFYSFLPCNAAVASAAPVGLCWRGYHRLIDVSHFFSDNTTCLFDRAAMHRSYSCQTQPSRFLISSRALALMFAFCLVGTNSPPRPSMLYLAVCPVLILQEVASLCCIHKLNAIKPPPSTYQ